MFFHEYIVNDSIFNVFWGILRNWINICDNFCQATINGSGYRSNSSSFNWHSCYATGTVGMKPSLDPYKNVLVLFYDKEEHIDVKYLFELLNIFNAERDEFKYKLIFQSTLNFEDMIELPKEYQKIAMMSYCFGEFNDKI